MAFDASRLTIYFVNANMGAGPTAAQRAVINTIIAQGAPEEQAMALVGTLVNDTTAVAALTYAYFGKTLPSYPGMLFLVNSENNPADLNDPYYVAFNQENRFLNFSLNLAGAASSPYSSAFASNFGAKSYVETVDAAYETIVGSAAARAAGLDPAAAKAFFVNALPFYEQVVQERAGLRPTDPGYGLAVKAALISGVMNASVNAGLGLYYDAYSKLVIDLEFTGPLAGTTKLGRDLFAAYPLPGTGSDFTGAAPGFNTAIASTSVQGITTSAVVNRIGATPARLVGSIIDGGGYPVGSAGDTLVIGDAFQRPVTLDDGGTGGQISNVQNLELLNGSGYLVTGPTVEGSGITRITFGGPTLFELKSSGQTITGSGGTDIVMINGLYRDVVFDGGAGLDIVSFGPGGGLAGASSLLNIEGVEHVSGVFTTWDSLIAAGASLAFSVTGANAVAAASFAAETNGALNFTMGPGGGVVEGTSNLLKDSFILPAGHAASTVDFADGDRPFLGNLVISFDKVDRVTGFNLAIDRIDLPLAVGAVVNSGASIGSSPLDLNVGGLAVGDVVIASGSGGVVYVIQNLGGSDINQNDMVIELAGLVGNPAFFSTANFV